MEIAVTGATGFIGSHIALSMIKRGHTVYTFGRKQQRDTPGIFTEWDITHGGLFNAPSVDVVIHCAALASDWAPSSDIFTANVFGTSTVAATFPRARQIIYISTASVYPKNIPKENLSEDTRILPGSQTNSYAASKFEGECVIHAAPQTSRVILRPHIVYGVGDRHILPRILRAPRFGKLFSIGDGTNHLSITAVENLVAAIDCAIQKQPSGCVTYNVADQHIETLDTLLSTLKKEFAMQEKTVYVPKKAAHVLARLSEYYATYVPGSAAPFLTTYVVEHVGDTFTLDITKIKRELEYQPITDYREGFAKLAQHTRL